MRTFLKRITQLTPVAAGLAAGLIAVGVVSIIGGNYANSVVRSQLVPQQIFFPKPAEWPALKAYAGQQVVTGTQAKLYANDQILPDMNKIAGGKTYSEISAKWIAGGMKNAALASERQTLFMGDTLRGLLLGAWGWGQIATYAILAGILLIIIGTLLFVLPVANWVLNIRPAREPKKSKAKVGSAAHAGV